jgi:hypothetical protein
MAALAALLVAGEPAPTAAQNVFDLSPNCWASTETASTLWPYWGTLVTNEEVAILVTDPVDHENFSVGFNLSAANGTDMDGLPVEEELRCTLIVPENFDRDDTNLAQVLVAGWAALSQTCTGSDCNTNRQVELTVAFANYGDSVPVEGLFTDTDTDVVTLTSETGCPPSGTTSCFRDRLKIFPAIDAVDANTDWSPGDLVFLSIRRSEPAGTELSEDFHVTSVRLRYTTWVAADATCRIARPAVQQHD